MLRGSQPARRDARGPEDADCPRNGGGTLKISAAAGVGSGARAGGGRAARVAARRRGARGPEEADRLVWLKQSLFPN